MPNSDFINSVLKNPCEGCPDNSPTFCSGLVKRGVTCDKYKQYKRDLNQTKVVLEWQKYWIDVYGNGQLPFYFPLSEIESLLKQLEEMER
jgi:hypothetical protein